MHHLIRWVPLSGFDPLIGIIAQPRLSAGKAGASTCESLLQPTVAARFGAVGIA